MQAAGLQGLMRQIAVAFPNPQSRAFPGTEFSENMVTPNFVARPVRPRVAPIAQLVKGRLSDAGGPRFESQTGRVRGKSTSLTTARCLKDV